MRKLIVQEFITLDGVYQAPGGPEEDETGQFKYGGWTAPYFEVADMAMPEVMADWMRSTDLLLGRKTFDIFAAYWPDHAEMWPGINEVTKYVASGSATHDEMAWPNVEYLDSAEAIKALKQTDGPDLKVHGSGNLVQTLLEHDLIDELNLMTFPITLGTGKCLFGEGTRAAGFKLAQSVAAPNGVIYARYERAGEIETGTVG